MSEKAGAKLPCPLCGHPLDPGASKCDNCGASVPKQTKDSLALLMKVLNVTPEQAARLYNLGYRKPDDLKEKNLWDVLEEEPKLFLCPECGAFVHEKDQKCQRCGAEFAGEAMEIEDYLLREERPCPHCGEPIHTDAILCPTCGKPVAEAKGVTLGSTYMCPSCGVTVLEGQKECEVCGASLSPTALIASKAMEMEAKACPKCGGTLDPETGICPFCSKKAEAEPDEAMEEIDQFLEHLASTPPGGGKLKVSPEEKPAKPPQMFVVEPPKPEIEKVAEKPLEKAPVTMEELEAEVALEQLEEEVKTLPMIKVLRPSHSKLPRSPPPVEAPAESGTLILVAELMLYATAFCLSLQYFASKTGSAALEWALFLFFGAAFGLSLGIIVLASKGMKAGMLRAWPQVVGTILIIAVPLERYLAASLSLGETYWFLGSTRTSLLTLSASCS